MTAAAVTDSQGKVQPDPTDPKKVCRGFKPHELCFERPRDGLARTEYLSEPFYAVILKTTEPCTVTEEERLQAQALFPRSKVFSMRFQCDDNIEENITYTNVDTKFGFLASSRVVPAWTARKPGNRWQRSTPRADSPAPTSEKCRRSWFTLEYL